MNKIIKQHQIDIAVYRSSTAEAVRKKKVLQIYDHLSRTSVFRFLWMNSEIRETHRSYILDNYPVLQELSVSIREFREIYQRRSMPLLYLFIERYTQSNLKELSCFAQELAKDIDAVENSVASALSNGFVEGTNNKVKMVKCAMYGRCGRDLLEAKLIYQH